MKILMFGGAFDPIHIGHISILKSCMQRSDFDRVIIMPTGTPTHKQECTAPFDVRLYMAKAVFENMGDNIEVSDFEGYNTQDNYTYLTLKHFKSKYKNADICMLIGSDSLMNLTSWKRYDYIIKNCRIISFARQEGVFEDMEIQKKNLEKLGASIEIMQDVPIEISSSFCRDNISGAEKYIPKKAFEIISEYKIYSKDDYERRYMTARLLAKILLDEKRYIHTQNVEKLAVSLGEIYCLDTKKLALAALLHDIQKNMPRDILLHRAKQSGIITKIDKKPMQTLHGFAAAYYARKEMNITDEDILWALKSHTCGRKGMGDYEKIIYLADMLCEERKFDEKEYLLSLAREDLNKAMRQSLICSVKWVKGKGKEIDADSIEALEYFDSLLGLDFKEEFL